VHQNGGAGVIGSDKVQAILLHFGIADTVMASGTMCSIDCPPNDLERRPGPLKMLVAESAGAAKIKKFPITSNPLSTAENCFGGQCRCRQKHDCSMRSLLLITFGVRRSLIKRSLFARRMP